MKTPPFILAALLVTAALSAQEPRDQEPEGGRNQDPWSAGTFSDFRLRAIGPALMSGRISHIAVHPENKQTWYLGVASGGVWKTTNAGITDDQSHIAPRIRVSAFEAPADAPKPWRRRAGGRTRAAMPSATA